MLEYNNPIKNNGISKLKNVCLGFGGGAVNIQIKD